jgi:hypothetical protein
VASNRTGFLAVAQKGRYLLMPGRPRLDDLQIIGVIELNCFVHGKKKACLVCPTMLPSLNLAEVLWYGGQDNIVGAFMPDRLTVIRVRKRECRKLLVECFTGCRRRDALRKQTPKNSFLRVVDDMNGRTECRIDYKRNRPMCIQLTWERKYETYQAGDPNL